MNIFAKGNCVRKNDDEIMANFIVVYRPLRKFRNLGVMAFWAKAFCTSR